MRNDSLGFFWQDEDHKNAKKREKLIAADWVELLSGYWVEQYVLDDDELDPFDCCMRIEDAYNVVKAYKEKREPPFPFWLDPLYIPQLERAKRAKFDLMTDEEFIDLALKKVLTGEREEMVFDIECYPNYFLIAFKHINSGKVLFFEIDDAGRTLDTRKLKWLFDHFTVIGFNSNNYDIPLSSIAVHGGNNLTFRIATVEIIEERMRSYNVLRSHKAHKTHKEIDYDHIDLMEVAPLTASLKIYGGRMGTRTMQDLPFPPETILTEDQKTVVRWYCINDLDMTLELRNRLTDQIQLRVDMSNQYKVDLRSKSDAQIAEAVIKHEIERISGTRIYPQKLPEGAQIFHYQCPSFIRFQTPMMQRILDTILSSPFIVGESGKVGIPDAIKSQKIVINNTTYKIGNGGLHSQEKRAGHFASAKTILKDWDVASYYPNIILNLGLFPENLGRQFLEVYRNIVETRLAAKARSKDESLDKTVRDLEAIIQQSLKIVINGSFGKFGSKYSTLYSPNLLIQTTVTGQLALLMLIEQMELNNIPCVSANTDGIVLKCPVELEERMNQIIKWWEETTNFDMEGTEYSGLFSRDVNNYIAIKKNAKTVKDIKTKGVFAKMSLSKTPANYVCVDAIKELFINETPIEKTIRECNDITKFTTVRNVKGGAVMLDQPDPAKPKEPVKTGEFLGKAVRWYYAKGCENNELIYAKNGNRVPRSDGCKPLMELPQEFPEDMNYDWYIKETEKMLSLMGYE